MLDPYATAPDRLLGARGLRVSALGVALTGSAAGVDRQVAHARSLGITLFDLAGPVSVPDALRSIGTRARSRPGIAIIPSERLRELSTSTLRSLVTRPFTTAPHPVPNRARIGVRLLIEASASVARQGKLADLAREVKRIDPPGSLAGVVLRGMDGTFDSETAAIGRRMGARWISGAASLMDVRGPSIVAHMGTLKMGYFVRDPFASGRFDGSMLERSPVEHNPREPPPTLEELEDLYRPVLPFGFLARPGARTIRGATIQYLLGLPTVRAIVLPERSEPHWPELARAAAAGPLDHDLLTRIDRVQAGTPARG